MNDGTNDWLEKTIRREGSVMFSAHPSAEELTLYTESEPEFPMAKRLEIEAHLRVCAACEDDRVRLLVAIDELREVEDKIPSAPLLFFLNHIRQWLAPVRWVPAVAAVAITILILGPNSDPPIVQPVGPAIVLRSDVERGVVPAVVPNPGGSLTFSFVLPGTSEGSIERCNVTILDADQKTVASVDNVLAFDDYGSFLLTFETEGLRDGNFTLVAQDRIGVQRFIFQLENSTGEPAKK